MALTDYHGIWPVCEERGKSLSGIVTHEGQPVHGPSLLWAIAGCESTYGRDRLFVRDEKAYRPGGKYGSAEHLQELWSRYGVLAASSYGSWQILYVSAWELGFKGHPIELQDDRTCAHWAATLISRRIVGHLGAKTLRDCFDGFNSGHPLDKWIPGSYVAKAIRIYEEVTK